MAESRLCDGEEKMINRIDRELKRKKDEKLRRRKSWRFASVKKSKRPTRRFYEVCWLVMGFEIE